MRKLFQILAAGVAMTGPAFADGTVDCSTPLGPGVRLVGCELDLKRFSGNLIGSDLTMARLRSVDFTRARMDDVILRYAVLSDADFDGADLEGADLSGADLSRTSLVGANLRGARLVNAVLVDADLTDADLTGANVYSADLTGARLAGAKLEKVIRDAPGSTHTEMQTAPTESSDSDDKPAERPTDAVSIDDQLARHIQQILKSEGHYPGPIDGDFGPVTRAGLRAFQQEAGLVVNGVLDHETLIALQKK